MLNIVQKLHPGKVLRAYQQLDPNDTVLRGDSAKNLMAAFVHARAGIFGVERLDADETALFQYALRLFGPPQRTEYGQRKARLLVPSDGGFPSGMREWGYRLTDERGQAEMMANLANDFPTVEIQQGEHTFKVRPWGLGYSVTYLDMQRAALAGVPFESDKIRAVNEGFEDLFEELCAGQRTGFTGLFDNANVTTSTVSAGTGGGVTWGSTKTTAEVVQDVVARYRAIRDATKERYVPNTLALPTAKADYLRDNFVQINNDNVRLLDEIFRRCPGLQNIEEWHYLSTAGSGSTNAGFMYLRDQDAVQVKWKEPIAMTPFMKNAAMVHNYLVEAGPVVFTKPVTAQRFDGI